MSDATFGDLVRGRREKLGISQSKLGELVGRSNSTIRSWERGSTTPKDEGLLRSVAAVLALPDTAIFEAAGLPPPVREHKPTIEQYLKGLSDSPAPAPFPPSDDGRFREDTPARREAEPTAPTVAAPLPREQPPLLVTSSPSYLEDPSERLTYRKRALLTASVGAGLLIVLMWSFSEARAALVAVWRSLTGGG